MNGDDWGLRLFHMSEGRRLVFLLEPAKVGTACFGTELERNLTQTSA